MGKWLWWPLHIVFLGMLFVFLWRVIGASSWDFCGTHNWPQAYVLAISDLGKGATPKVISIDDEVYLGRDSHNDIVLDDQFVSTVHARIYLRGEEYWLEDLGSRNRTYVNGELVITPQKLRQAAIISMGNAVVVFHTSPNSPVGKG